MKKLESAEIAKLLNQPAKVEKAAPPVRGSKGSLPILHDITPEQRKHPLALWLYNLLEGLVQGDECLEWKHSKNDKGYGQLTFSSRNLKYAHRTVYQQIYGPVENNIQICHYCDNPSCIRPKHLFAGTASENMQDMLSKNRQGNTGSPGSSHGMHKLVEEQVIEIRRLYALGGETYESLAKSYNVGWTTIQKIVTRHSWRHI